MIALLNGLPLVVLPTGDAMAFESEWLKARLEGAASRAGHPDWWQAEDVTALVRTYLQRHYDRNSIGSAGLDHVVTAALCAIGYAEVARCLDLK